MTYFLNYYSIDHLFNAMSAPIEMNSTLPRKSRLPARSLRQCNFMMYMIDSLTSKIEADRVDFVKALQDFHVEWKATYPRSNTVVEREFFEDVDAFLYENFPIPMFDKELNVLQEITCALQPG